MNGGSGFSRDEARGIRTKLLFESGEVLNVEEEREEGDELKVDEGVSKIRASRWRAFVVRGETVVSTCSNREGVVHRRASSFLVERRRRVRCWESILLTVGGGVGKRVTPGWDIRIIM